jgi:hypothetical protein
MWFFVLVFERTYLQTNYFCLRAPLRNTTNVPHLTFIEIATLAGLRALWKAPDWGLKLVALADEIRRFRG